MESLALPYAIDRSLLDLAKHPHLTLLLDLDGTLIPFAETPEAAVLDNEVVSVVQALQHSGVNVVMVSGRPRCLVEPLRDHLPNLRWMAEHGSWHCDTSGAWVGPQPASELGDLVAALQAFAIIPGVRLEAKSLSICLHWRLVPARLKQELVSSVELTCEEWLEAHPEFERLDGVEMIEVRRRSSNKSRAVTWVRGHNPGARIIAIGDDRTDEDMFSALREGELAISVGTLRSRAHYSLDDHSAVRSFLGWLGQARSDREPEPFFALAPRPRTRPAATELLVVSNRIPPPLGGRQRSVGGLVSAIEPALRAHGGMWLGWNGEEVEGERTVTVDLESVPKRASFEFPTGWREHFYGGFCNRALWPLFHGFPGRVRYADEDWQAYVEANDEFARHARSLVTPSGMVWFHDYHLLLAGRALHRQGFRGRVGMFLHIPFPSPDLFETMPWADELASAMFDFDLVGFHTEQWADNFRACARLHAHGRSLPRTCVLPIGVDPEMFGPAGPIDPDIEGLRLALGNRRLILGVDRLDYAKGIPERLLAFECFLERSPEWRSQVSFVQVSVPSRDDVPEYAELRHRVENLVGRINGRFGEADWVPVRYLYRSYDHRVLAQLYRLADVALVTPLRDGLNLVAKEFVLAQAPERPGVLVLSRFAGAAAELRDAILTNPFHPEGLATDIDRALRMDLTERRRRHDLLAATLAGHTPQRWAATFLRKLRG